MVLNADDIEVVFALRHDAKVNGGLTAAYDAVESLVRGREESAAIAFNRGLCAYEIGDGETAHWAFVRAITIAGASKALGRFSVDAIELAIGTATAPLDGKCQAAMTSLAGSFSGAEAVRLFEFVVSRISNDSLYDLLWTVIEEGAAYGVDVLGDVDRLRTFYEVCSARNDEDRCAAYLRRAGGETEPMRDHLEILNLIFNPAGDHAAWIGRVENLIARMPIGEHNASDVAIAAIGMASDEVSIPLLERLASQYPNSENLVRLQGVANERRGDRFGAIGCYQRAASLATPQNDGAEPSAPRAASVSAIALSYNDGPLVRHFCRCIAPHCDELIVNDGGSTDGTVDLFRQFSEETGFPIFVIEDFQYGNRQRTMEQRDDYRLDGLGGVRAFEADRRRTTTLMQARGEFVLMVDLDDYLPPFPNLKTLVEASPNADRFAGSRAEPLGGGRYAITRPTRSDEARPVLFRRHPRHVYGGVGGADEYLARLDLGIRNRSSVADDIVLSQCFTVWHIGALLDDRLVNETRASKGAAHPLALRFDRPLMSALPLRAGE